MYDGADILYIFMSIGGSDVRLARGRPGFDFQPMQNFLIWSWWLAVYNDQQHM